jgi:hypothetical protein
VPQVIATNTFADVRARLALRDVAVCAALVAALSVTWLPRAAGPADLRWDAAVYYGLGTSLAAGDGYTIRSEPGRVTTTVWPPLLPITIAAFERTLHTTDPVVVGRWLRGWCFVIWAAYIALAFLVLRQIGSRLFAVAGTLLTGLHMSTVWLSDRVYADLPFAVCVLAAVAAARSRRRYSELLVFVCATAAYGFRTAGLALFGAWILESIVARDWRLAMRRTALAAVPILAWAAFVGVVERRADYAHPPYEYARARYELYNVSYGRNMVLVDPNDPSLGIETASGLARRAVHNLRTTIVHLGEAVTALERDWTTLVVAAQRAPIIGRLVPWRTISWGLIFFGVLTVSGLALMAIRGERLPVMLVICYVGLLSMLPTDYHWPRYLAAIAPLLCGALLLTAQRIGEACRPIAFTPRRGGRIFASSVAAAALIVQAATLCWYFTRDFRRVTYDDLAGHRVEFSAFTYDPAFEAFDTGITWVQAHARSDDIVLSSMPHWVYLRTGLHGATPPFEHDVAEARRLIATLAPRFAIVDNSGFSAARVYAGPVLTSPGSGWVLRYSDASGLVQVYEHEAGT